MPLVNSDIISWNVSLSMDSGITANVEVSNHDEQYDPDSLVNEQITLFAQANNTAKQWFRGVITNANPTWAVGGKKTISLQCNSVHQSLSKKPINTEKYASITGEALLNELLGTYGSLDSSFFNFAASSGTTFTNVLVSGNSILDAVRLIAQASLNEVYTSRLGVMVTEAYKLVGDATDLTVDEKLVSKVTRSANNQEPKSRVRVRGNFITVMDSAATNLFNANIVLWVPTETRSMDIQMAITDSVMLENMLSATYTVTTPPGEYTAKIRRFSNEFPNHIIITIRKVGNFLFGPGIFPLTLAGVGFNQSITEFGGPSNATQLVDGRKPTEMKLLRVVESVSKATPRRSGLVKLSDKSADEEEDNRIDVVVTDAGLVAIYGVRWDEVDNPYIPTEARATEVGERVLQEFRQSQRTWQVDLAYEDNAGFDLNKKVVVPKPESTQTITGVIRSINLSYSPATPALSMSAVVEEFPP